MTKPAVKTSYTRVPDSGLLVSSQKILASLSGNLLFVWDETTLPTFKRHLDDFTEKLITAKSRNPAAICQKNMARMMLLNDLRLIAMQVNIQADGDLNMLLSSGFPACKERLPIGMLDKPTGFKVVSGSNRGELVCSVGTCSTARMYCFFYAEAPATNSVHQWNSVLSSTRKKRIVGLTPGKLYEFRCAYKGSVDDLCYSDSILIYAQ